MGDLGHETGPAGGLLALGSVDLGHIADITERSTRAGRVGIEGGLLGLQCLGGHGKLVDIQGRGSLGPRDASGRSAVLVIFVRHRAEVPRRPLSTRSSAWNHQRPQCQSRPTRETRSEGCHKTGAKTYGRHVGDRG